MNIVESDSFILRVWSSIGARCQVATNCTEDRTHSYALARDMRPPHSQKSSISHIRGSTARRREACGLDCCVRSNFVRDADGGSQVSASRSSLGELLLWLNFVRCLAGLGLGSESRSLRLEVENNTVVHTAYRQLAYLVVDQCSGCGSRKT